MSWFIVLKNIGIHTSKLFSGTGGSIAKTGVKVGVGAGSTAGGFALLNYSIKDITAPLEKQLGITGISSLLMIGGGVLVLIMLLRGKRR